MTSLTDREALNYAASLAATLRYFPRRDAAARGELAQLIQELVESAEEAEWLIEAVTRRRPRLDWRGPASFRETVTPILEAFRKRSARVSDQACSQCPFASIHTSLSAAERVQAIKQAQEHCTLSRSGSDESPCIYLPTALVLQAEERADARARTAIRKLAPSEREKLRLEAEREYAAYSADNSGSGWQAWPFLKANIEITMTVLMRRKEGGAA